MQKKMPLLISTLHIGRLERAGIGLRRLAFGIPLVVTLIAFGCTRDKPAELAASLASTPDTLARRFISYAQSGDFARAEQMLASNRRTEASRAAIESFGETIGSRKAAAVSMTGFEETKGNDAESVTLDYEFAFTDHWTLVEITVLHIGTSEYVDGALAQRVPLSAAAVNRLTLRGKPIVSYVVAFLAILVPAFMIWTCWRVVAERALPGRLWWAAASLVALGAIRFNWTDLSCETQPLRIVLGGIGIYRAGGPYLPWMILIGLPIGAFLAQARLRSLRATVRAEARAARED